MPNRRIQSHVRQTVIKRDESVRVELAQAIRDVGATSNEKHKAVVSDWEHKPDFYTVYTIAYDLISMRTEARGKNKLIWSYVNQGTKPHIIRPVNAPRLKFQTGYSPRTKAPAKAHQGTGTASGGWVSTQIVHHPGNEARDFTGDILDDLSKDFTRNIENAIKRGIRRAK